MKRKQNWIWVLIVLLLIVIGLMLLPRKAGASDGFPENVVAWEYAGELFVTDYRNGRPVTKHICPCEVSLDCEVSPNGEKPTPTENPQPTPTDKPDPTPKPTKVKCNSGRGNDSEGSPEDCDPGNSGGHNQGGD